MHDRNALATRRRAAAAPLVVAALTLVVMPSVPPRSGAAPALDRLLADTAGRVEIVPAAVAGRAAFVRGLVPVAVSSRTERDGRRPRSGDADGLARGVLDRYAPLFGVSDADAELDLVAVETDVLGATHVRYRQVHAGVPVHLARVSVHLDGDRRHVTAIVSGAVSGIELASTSPVIGGWRAVRTARRALPGGVLAGQPRLVVHAPDGDGGRARLAWVVELVDADVPARGLYVVDAADGSIVEVLPGVHEALRRATYDARDRFAIPLLPRRTEGAPPIGIADVDAVHDAAGATYEYYAGTHGRDSWNDAGATIRQIARFGNGYANAGWVGSFAVYGGGLAGLDVIAHELTHGVVQSEAGLVYSGQPGALNESFADMFGAMVDRDDWEIGEDTILGPIRDLADPPRFGQPGHSADYVVTCEDNLGVHINSGITNKAFHDIAQNVGLETAEAVFYRALTVYLHPRATLEEARAAALAAAADLHGAGGAIEQAVAAGFANVGLDGTFAPPAPQCACAAFVVTADADGWDSPLAALRAASTLYRLRDEALAGSSAGHDARRRFERHTGRAAALLLADPALRHEAAALLGAAVPRLERALDDPAAIVVDGELAAASAAFLERLAAADRSRGGGALAVEIDGVVRALRATRSTGLTLDDAIRRIAAE